MKNVHLLFGEEVYLLEERIDSIVSTVLDENDSEFNVTAYDLAETPITEVINDCNTLSFDASQRVIIAKDAWFLSTEQRKSKIEHNIDRLVDYMKNPNPDTVLLLVANVEKLDQRKKAVKELKKSGEVFEAKPIKGFALQRWIKEKVSLTDSNIEDTAAQLLSEYVGPNLKATSQEIQKLSLYVQGGTISEKTVKLLVSRSLEQNIFEMIDKVVQKRFGEAFQMLDDLIKQGEDPIALVILIARQFRIIYQVRALHNSRLTTGDIAKQLALAPFIVSKAKEQSSYFSLEQLRIILNELSDLDYKLKTGQAEKRLALEVFITKLSSNKGWAV